MVYSEELGYDPEEWEECEEPDHFLAFSFGTRVFLSVATILLSVLLFWILEVNKKISTTPEEKRRRLTLCEEGCSTAEERFARVTEECASSQRGRRRSSKRQLTEEEMQKLEEWDEERKRVVDHRLRASEEPPQIEVDATSTFGLQTGAFDNQSLLSSEFSPFGKGTAAQQQQTTSMNIKKDPPCSTPPSTPINPVSVEKPSESEFRELASKLEAKLIEELNALQNLLELDTEKLTKELQQKHQQTITEGISEFRHPGADSVTLNQQLQEQIATVVSNEIMRKSSSAVLSENAAGLGQQARSAPTGDDKTASSMMVKATNGSSSSDEGFVKINGEHDQQHHHVVEDRPTFGLEEHHHHSPPVEDPHPGGVVLSDYENVRPDDVRISMLSNEADTTTADDIEFVQNAKGRLSMDGATAVNSGHQERPHQLIPLAGQEGILLPADTEGSEGVSRKYAITDAALLSLPTSPDSPEFGDVKEVSKPPNTGTTAGNKADQQVQEEYELSVVVRPFPSTTQQQSPAPQTGSSNAAESPSSFGFDIVNIPDEEVQEVVLGVMPECKSSMFSERKEEQPPVQEEYFNIHRQEQQIQRDQLDDPEIPRRGSKTEERQQPELGIMDYEAENSIHEWVRKADTGKQQQQQIILQQQKTTDFGMEQPEEEPKRISKSFSDDDNLIVEEDMLESDNQPDEVAANIKQQTPIFQQQVSPEAPGSAEETRTSRQIKTNEEMEEERLVFDDADDNVTYAPEIQSVEIPPDQLSQSSLNLVENFSEHQELHQHIQQVPEVEDGEEAARRRVPSGEKEEQAVPEQHAYPSPRDEIWRAPSPRRSTIEVQQAPQAPQFIRNNFDEPSVSSLSSSFTKHSSLLSALGVTSTQDMLLKIKTLDALSDAMRMAGLGSSNLIFGIDYTASNKYQGERSFDGRSLHSVDDRSVENPYQQVIKVVSKTLAPFATDNGIPVFGFGDATTGDWSVFPLYGSKGEYCRDLDEVLRVYNEATPGINLSGPTNFAPLIYRAMEICQHRQDYHILVIIADGQVTNERATRKAIVNACQFPLSIIVVGVGDGPWEMMKVFDESLPKRPWDNFHFVEFNEVINDQAKSRIDPELSFAIHSLLEVPDQYVHIRKMGLLGSRGRPLAHYSPRSRSPKLMTLNVDREK